MDGWVDGCSVNKREAPRHTNHCKPSIDGNFEKTQSYVVWLVRWLLGWLDGLLVWHGRSVGWHSVDGCMDPF